MRAYPQHGDLGDVQRRLIEAKADRARLEVEALRRREAAEAGRWVLRSEADRIKAAMVADEVLQFESVFHEAAPLIAAETSADYATVKAILSRCWREHRARRAELLERAAAEAHYHAADDPEADEGR